MGRTKTLTPVGPTDDDGSHRNGRVSLNRAEFGELGVEPGDDVEVRVRDGKIEIVPAERERATPFQS